VVGTVALSDLLRDRESLVSRLRAAVIPLRPLGVELVDVDLLAVEVRVGPELLRLLG